MPPIDSEDPSDASAIPAWLTRPSKTRRKKDSHDLQDLDESLLDAIRQYRVTRTHEGRRRQMQYIGKLMRRNDPEPLREAVAAMQLGQAKDALALHDAERWRNELIASDSALDGWLAEHPQADVQQLRSLIRAARKDASVAPEQRSGKAFRELFRFLRQNPTALAAGTDPDANDEEQDE
jgi:ribosome-associated protein